MTGRGVIEEFDPRDTISVVPSTRDVGDDKLRVGENSGADAIQACVSVENAGPTSSVGLCDAGHSTGPSIFAEWVTPSMRHHLWVGTATGLSSAEPHTILLERTGLLTSLELRPPPAPLRIHPSRHGADEGIER